MKTNKVIIRLTAVIFMGVLAVLLKPVAAGAHCDTLDGPVVNMARTALEAGDVTPILKWVKADHEVEIKEAFDRTLAVRKLGPDAKELADHYFFETLVRVHRAGEGAPYTGLKPAGEVEPPIAAADKALENGSVDELIGHVQHEVEAGIRERYEKVVETAKHKDESVEAGREYVEAYVVFTHYIEGLHKTIGGGAHHAEAQGSGSSSSDGGGHQH